jgi:hypothetical protein
MISVLGLPKDAVLCNQKTMGDEMMERRDKRFVPSPYGTAKADAATRKEGLVKAPRW